MDLATHRLSIESSAGWDASQPLTGQSAAGLFRWVDVTLAAVDIELDLELLMAFDGETILPYDTERIDSFRQVTNWVDAAFKAFKSRLRGEPVQDRPSRITWT